MTDPKRVFISHVAENRAFAARLGDLMAARGATVFLDADVQIGDLWSDVVRTEMEKASALVLLIPPEGGTDRNNVWFEAGAARALGKRILAVMPPENRSFELPSQIADVFVLDTDQRPLESIADTLMQAVPGNSEALPS